MRRRARALAVAAAILAGSVGLSQACPTVCVIIPETVIIQRIPRPIPDPAAETAWMTVDARVFDLHTAEFKAYAITANVTGIEIFGFRFGASPQDVARAVGRDIVARLRSKSSTAPRESAGLCGVYAWTRTAW